MNRELIAAVVVLVVAACDGREDARLLDVGTTTSVANSGLTDVLLPQFERETGITVRLMLAGSGRALRMLARGDVAAAISHAPELEARALREHPTWWYRKFMFNDFVIVGPREDPEHVSAATSAGEAFERIGNGHTKFVSRGDESGTHAKEQALWREAGAAPSSDVVISSGQGMAGTLRVASAQSAYTLTDRATFSQLASALDLAVLFEGDPLLLNTYAVIVADPEVSKAARVFGTWLVGANARETIRAFRVGANVRAFSPWPEHKPASSPGDRP